MSMLTSLKAIAPWEVSGSLGLSGFAAGCWVAFLWPVLGLLLVAGTLQTLPRSPHRWVETSEQSGLLSQGRKGHWKGKIPVSPRGAQLKAALWAQQPSAFYIRDENCVFTPANKTDKLKITHVQLLPASSKARKSWFLGGRYQEK